MKGVGVHSVSIPWYIYGQMHGNSNADAEYAAMHAFCIVTEMAVPRCG